MMILRVLPLVVLLGCSPMGLGGDPASAGVPEELRSCPAAAPAVALPPPPRSLDSVVEWGQKTEEARAATAQSLEVCRSRLIRLLGMTKQ